MGMAETAMDTRRLSICLLVAVCMLLVPVQRNGTAQAADKSLRFECAWDLSEDLKTGLVQRVSGFQMLVFKTAGGTYGRLEVEGMSYPFLASINSTYLTAEAHYKSGATAITEKIEINRFTGSIRKWLRWEDHGSLYQGKCTVVNGKLF